MNNKKKILFFLVIMAILTPLGLLLPKYFNSGDAWGEWSVKQVKEQTGIEPEGMKKDAEKYEAPLPDYSNGKENPLRVNSYYYILSATIGALLVMGVSYGLMKLLTKKE